MPGTLPPQTISTSPAARTRYRTHGEPAPTADLHQRQLEKSVSWSGRERLRYLWYRPRLTGAEINYATRHMVEQQTPWISDNHPGP